MAAMTKWIEKKKDWLGDRRHKRDGLDKQGEQEKNPEMSDYGVIFVPLRCPRCGSKKVKCHTSKPPIRYHICRECMYRFKSIEES